MQHWLVKSEPFKYSWNDLVKQGVGTWDGVRNYAARLHLMAMKIGDLVFFYHSNEGLEIVGLAEIVKEHYQDPTTEDTRWVVVDLKPIKAFAKPVKLENIKKDANLKDMVLVNNTRLSVQPVSKYEFDYILSLGYE